VKRAHLLTLCAVFLGLPLLPGAPVDAAPRTVADVVDRYRAPVEARLKPSFTARQIAFPPRKLTLIALKEERLFELWAESAGQWKRVRSYPILAASGRQGPKLLEGDLQVPEGVYRIALLNPNSSYHLSMKIDYPNAFDRQQAKQDGRTRLGGEIFIHGKDVSIGCVALGDEAIEELFFLVAKTGRENTQVIFAPFDLRKRPPGQPPRAQRPWIAQLYHTISAELKTYPTGP